MRCPYCGYSDTKVTDSRDADDGIRRRRECLNCGQRFTTMERSAMSELFVAKKDGRREEFSRDKLMAGIRKACEKRPLAAGTVEAIVDAVESSLRQSGAPEVPSEEIGEQVMSHLRELDHIAYIRFASVYREFADLEEMQQELHVLASRGAPPGPDAGQPSLIAEDDLKTLTRGLRAFPAQRAKARRRGRPRKSSTASAEPTVLPTATARERRRRS